MSLLTLHPIARTPARREAARRVASFAAIGVASTGAYLVLYLLLRPFGAQPANAAALLLTAVANTAANRWFTFGVRGVAGSGRHHLQGLVVFAVGLAVTSGALAGCHALIGTANRAAEVVVLVAANLTATVIRFLAMSIWVFGPDRARSGP